MREEQCESTPLEKVLLVCVVAVALAAGAFLLVALGRRAAEERKREAILRNLGQITEACITYQAPSGEFFPSDFSWSEGDFGADTDADTE